MSTPGKRVPDLVLDRYLAGDLAPRARAELERELGSSPELRARLDELRAQRDAFLAEEPPERFAHRVAAKVATERRARPRLLLWLAPASAAAVGVLAVAFALRHGDDRPGLPAAWHEERAPSAQTGPAPAGESAAAPLAQAQAPVTKERAPTAAPDRKPIARGFTPPRAKAHPEAHPRVPRDSGSIAERERERIGADLPAAGLAEPSPGQEGFARLRRDRAAEPLAKRSIAPSAAPTALPAEPSPPSGAANSSPPLAAASRPESVVPPASRPSSAALREAPAPRPGPTITTRGALDTARVTPVMRASLPRLMVARRAAGVSAQPLTVTIDIDARGSVTAARVLSPALTGDTARPILAVLRALRFPAVTGSTVATMTVPAAP